MSRVIVVLLLLLFLTAELQAKEWRGIIPLRSTRVDVERLLGQPGEHGRYQFEDERAYINYADGQCDRTDRCECLVPEGTVIEIRVVLEDIVKFSEVGLDLTSYERTDNGAFVTYANDEEGIIYTVSKELDEVHSISYIPSARDCEEIVRRRAGCNPNPQNEE